jgi:RHS repeat-associated protein
VVKVVRKGVWGESFDGGVASQPAVGQWFDAESGLHYNVYRYFDPELGRYLTPDPIGTRGGLNEYAPVPSPVMWMDPLGLANIRCDGEEAVLEIKDKYPPGSRQSRQLRRFVKAWNGEIELNGGSMTTRRETPEEVLESNNFKSPDAARRTRALRWKGSRPCAGCLRGWSFRWRTGDGPGLIGKRKHRSTDWTYAAWRDV